MQGSGNGRGRQSQHVHVLLHLLDLLLVGHAKALLLVHDQKAEVPELHILGQDPVGADHNVHHALAQVLQGLFLLGRGAEPAEHIHPHRKILHALDKRVVMLLGQDGGGHQVHHLFAVLHRLEGGSEGHLGFAVAHVPADQPVHDLPALHVVLHRIDGVQLVVRLIVGKELLKLPLPHRILPVLESRLLLPGRVELHQVLCDLLDRALHPALGLGPLAAPKAVQLGLLGLGPRVLLDALKTGGWQIQVAAVPVLDLDVVLGDLIPLHLLDAAVNAQSVLLVDHVVAHRQLGKTLDGLALVIRLFPALFLLLHAEHVALGDKDELDQRILEAPVQVAVGDQNLAGPDLGTVLDRGFLLREAAAGLPGNSVPAASRRSASIASRRFAFLLPHRRIRAEGFQIILPQVAGQAAGPGP